MQMLQEKGEAKKVKEERKIQKRYSPFTATTALFSPGRRG
jgi:hypothetical protein